MPNPLEDLKIKRKKTAKEENIEFWDVDDEEDFLEDVTPPKRERVLGHYEGADNTEVVALKAAVSQLLIVVYALWKIVQKQTTSENLNKVKKELREDLANIAKALVIINDKIASPQQGIKKDILSGAIGGVIVGIVMLVAFFLFK